MKRAILIFALLRTATAACIPITGDRVAGSDLARADEALAAFPSAMTVAFAPVPGKSLIVSASDIVRLAKSHDVTLASIPTDVCFAVTMRKLASGDAVSAMRNALPSGATVEIVELPVADLPAGELHFPLATLEPVSDPRNQNAQIWRGFVQYTPTRRAPFLTRVRLRNGLEELVLTTDVARGSVFTRAMFTAVAVAGLVPKQAVATRPEQVLGTAAKADLKSGQRIPLSAVEQPVAVKRGDVVNVEVRSGAARLQLDAIAQRAARDGEIMEFLNPLTGKMFKARLEGSRAVVNVGGRL